MKKTTLLYFFITSLLLPQVIHSTSFIMDRYASPYSAAHNLIEVQNTAIQLQDRIKKQTNDVLLKRDPKKTFSLVDAYELSVADYSTYKSLSKMGIRTGELALIWHPINLMTSVLQHEVFGHGYRVRSFGPKVAKVTDYRMQYKIGKKGLMVKDAYTLYRFNDKRSFSEEIAVSIAGLEANFIFAHNILFSWIEKGSIDGRQASLWRRNQFACSRYIHTLEKFTGKDAFLYGFYSGHDIASFFSWLNICYPNDKHLNLQFESLKLKSKLTILLNPITYLSYLSEAAYVIFNSPMPVFGFSSNGYKVLPAYKMGLTPFGVEDIFELFVWGNGESPIYSYIKYGKLPELLPDVVNEYYGCGIEGHRVYRSKYGDLGWKLDAWVQPDLITQKIDGDSFDFDSYVDRASGTYRKSIGGAACLIYQKNWPSKPNAGISAILGAKSSGFLPGESLNAAPIIRVGASLDF